jgi:glycosyltransferase involved in cell wall biosynthesis
MDSHRPRVSIGIPVFNGERYLKETLDSLLRQTYKDFEIVISDNASTDYTETICRNYAASDRRIRYYRNERNLGMAANFRRVFELRTGEYFKWAAADDLCVPEYLERCVGILDADSKVVLACAGTLYIDENGEVLGKSEPVWNLLSESAYERLRHVIYFDSHGNLEAWLGLVRAEALSKTNLMPSYPCGDKRPLGELSLSGKFLEIPEYLCMRRLHPETSSRNAANVEWMEDFFKTKSLTLCLPTWRLCFDHFITVIRSGLRIKEKLSLLVAILKSMYWYKARIAREINVAIRYIFVQRKVLARMG